MTCAYRRNKYLKDILVHMAFNEENKKEVLQGSEISFICLTQIFNLFSAQGSRKHMLNSMARTICKVWGLRVIRTGPQYSVRQRRGNGSIN